MKGLIVSIEFYFEQNLNDPKRDADALISISSGICTLPQQLIPNSKY